MQFRAVAFTSRNRAPGQVKSQDVCLRRAHRTVDLSVGAPPVNSVGLFTKAAVNSDLQSVRFSLDPYIRRFLANLVKTLTQCEGLPLDDSRLAIPTPMFPRIAHISSRPSLYSISNLSACNSSALAISCSSVSLSFTSSSSNGPTLIGFLVPRSSVGGRIESHPDMLSHLY